MMRWPVRIEHAQDLIRAHHSKARKDGADPRGPAPLRVCPPT